MSQSISTQPTENLESTGFQNVPINSPSMPMTAMSTNSSSSLNKSFKNGDLLVSLAPINKHCPWITPAAFKPELVPEQLMASKLSITVEDYVLALQMLVNDYRFKIYVIFYKRILFMGIALGFILLMSLLLSGARSLTLFAGGVLWLILNAFGIFASMWIKTKLLRLLEKCVGKVNEIFIKHHILLGVDDKGKLSCHKVNLVFIYFEVRDCIKYLDEMLEAEEAKHGQPGQNQPQLPEFQLSRADIDANDIIITGSADRRISQEEKYGVKLLLRYVQRWVKDYNRSRIDLNTPFHGDASIEANPSLPPRHCATSRCLCQYIEEHLRFKSTTGCSITELFM